MIYMNPMLVGAAIGVGKDAMGLGIAAAKTVASGYGRRSISRLAKDAIFQFPTMFSSDIDTDDIQVIAQSFEKEYASFVVAAIALEPNVDMTQYTNTRDYLRTFHSNSNVPASVYNTGNLVLESLLYDAGEFIIESATAAAEGTTYVDPMVIRSLWTCNEAQYDTETLNNIYRPFDRTYRKLANRLSVANEAGLSYDEQRELEEYKSELTANREFNKQRMQDQIRAEQRREDNEHRRQEMYEQDRLRREADEMKASRDARISKQINNSGTGTFKSQITDNIDCARDDFYKKHARAQSLKDFTSSYAKKGSPTVITTTNHGTNTITRREDKFSAMEPTIVNVSIMNTNGQTTWGQNVVLGIKAMIRLVPSTQMVSNMVEATEDRAIFKFIKWTKGEMKLTDVLFGKRKYKKMGIENAKHKWLAALKKRAAIDNVSRFMGARLLPNATIIITETEAMEVEEATGLDLHNVGVINKIMKKYFLLGFGIYDTNTRILTAIFDGDTSYTQVPFRALAAGIKKETDLLNAPQKRF